IICAAGKGTRAGFSENKVLKELNGLPVLSYSLSAFSPLVDEILVTASEEDEARIVALLSPYPNARTVLGGNTRGESVYYALNEAKGAIVLVHDAARPFVTQKIILDCIESVQKYGSGVCALPATDTVVLTKDNHIMSAPARESVYTVQTPQGFYTEKLLCAYEHAEEDERTFTDESGVYAAYIAPPRLFVGDRQNKKLTYSEDFRPAERVGFGVDTHAFGQIASNSFITLGGVKVPSHAPLIAHSDGDVLVHALMDALLSAAGLRDIGYYFPDTDESYRGANSMELLAKVLHLVRGQGLKPHNVSISVLAEKPRLAPYIEQMKSSLATALSLPLSNIGIAAGTNEKLGYIGEGKGITVYCTVQEISI
ncbi:MAG: 2-C-methyl-D-erythritol 2,4-cyclodiphosphate synthase, partial [Clostridiales bacterium]|nr:2-C-methyl-D-erythritol 2,4-cyclodiphosphate synthase [Clostridiales bacterium]